MKKRTAKKAFQILSLSLGVAILLIFLLFAIAPKAFAPCDPKHSYEAFLGISGEHILGTNNLGYDIFSELVYATRSTLLAGLLAALISLVTGTLIGLLSGYAKGVVGEAMNGVINFFLLIPMLPLAIVIGAYLDGGFMDIVLTISLIGWCSTARAVRAKTIKLKSAPFIKIMRGLGYSRVRILFCHILPNVLDVAAAKFITTVASCILLEATLGFLGVGSKVELSWGVMINYAYRFGGLARGAYNWLLAPGVCITLLELAFYFIGSFAEGRLSVVKGGRSVLE